MFLQITIPLSALLALTATGLDAQCGPLYDYAPSAREVILNTDFTQITPVGCPPISIVGGVFLFRNVTIPLGVHVRGTGSRPMIWVVTGTFRVDGDISVNGSGGGSNNPIGSSRLVNVGGRGECTGGNGGRGSPNATGRSYAGEPGYGPMNTPFLGGHSGVLGYQPVSGGSGGGGGVFATAGDPYYRASDGLPFPQQFGYGGSSPQSPWNPGGAPGTTLFVDGRPENNFFGTGYDLNQRIAIPGELKQPFGGQGGAGGGDYTQSLLSSYLNDDRGAGGGAGGGVIVVVALGQISIGVNGHISVDGGYGGSGIGANSYLGGGGGGGSGGMVILASKTKVQLHAHGETYANQDYDFVLSADGAPSAHGGVKYPPSKSTGWQAAGGFGGLGIIQIHTPVGNNSDGTNTVFDDNIDIMKNGVALQGSAKQRYIAWRGYPDAAGMLADDSGVPTNIGSNAGDMRPTPILLPLF